MMNGGAGQGRASYPHIHTSTHPPSTVYTGLPATHLAAPPSHCCGQLLCVVLANERDGESGPEWLLASFHALSLHTHTHTHTQHTIGPQHNGIAHSPPPIHQPIHQPRKPMNCTVPQHPALRWQCDEWAAGGRDRHPFISRAPVLSALVTLACRLQAFLCRSGAADVDGVGLRRS